jgi:hypothetical protein
MVTLVMDVSAVLHETSADGRFHNLSINADPDVARPLRA